MYTVFFFLLHFAKLGTACGEFRYLSEGNYLSDNYSGYTETMRTSFHLSGLSKKSVGSKGSSRKLWAFPPVTWLDPVSARVVNVLHVLELKVQMWARLRLSAFQRQPGSGVRQICRQFILAQCDESSDSMETHHICVMLKIERKGARVLGLKQQNTEI